MIRNTINSFINNRNVGEQRNNVKAGHKYVGGIDISVQEFLNEGETMFDDELIEIGVRKGMNAKNLAILYTSRKVINAG